MLKNLQKLRAKKAQEGFTIIEVMIVLAIGGLIILVVLLAIPALQRNGRNTAIKNDASAIAAGIAEFSSNNDGKSPNTSTAFSQTGGTVTLGASSDTVATVKIQGGTTASLKLSGTVPTVTTTPAIVPGIIEVWAKYNCSGTATNRSFAIWYSVETSNGAKNQCLES